MYFRVGAGDTSHSESTVGELLAEIADVPVLSSSL